MIKKRGSLWATILTLLILGTAPAASDEIMDRIDRTGMVRIGFRQDAIPFAYIDPESGRYIGFSVDMAALLVENLSKHFGKKISIEPVAINTENRIPMIVNHEIDVEMGSTTYNQVREKEVDFSLLFFISETTFMVRSQSFIRTMNDIDGKTVGAAAGTTNLSALQALVKVGKFKSVNIRIIKTISQGFIDLKKGEIDALCLDRTLLNVMRIKDSEPQGLTILNFAISYEPYAYMVPKNNSDFRNFLNDTIRWSLNTNKFYEIYERWMGENGEYPFKIPPGFKEYLNVIAVPMNSLWWKE